ncbi:General transcription and DNA repair factor IIH subunit TFB2 [Lachnellula cervina]|uniref:RNA polymerase II transcription factor B subunit 2 n=1 Tax=Lachnellula cervina TaxID=1316786 RepID=A0A7D8YLZ8_9HELO|nr:General transcription and DNA repair factor IIH subunit TFB2 [Lachnellula cervina]
MSVSSLASFEYLEALPGTTFRRLYLQPSTTLAIFRRMLPHLAKTFVMSMLYMTKPIPLTDLDLWVHPSSKRQPTEALSLLSRLHIVHITARTRDDPQVVSLTKAFGSSLRLALTGGGDHQSFGVPSNDSTTADVDLNFLDDYAQMQWEGILHFVVSSVGEGMRQGGQGPTAAVKQLLESGNLVTRARHSGGGITQAGFSFLLQEANAQVWTLLLLWIKNADKMEMDSVDVLSFLFMLGSLELGRAYSTTTLTASQKQMITYLVDFGLVYIPPSTKNQFFPTRLATTLTSDATALRSVAAGFDAAHTNASAMKGFIIIETNYRLYAYTTSPLQIAVLSLFTKLTTRYPNMVSGRITRESIYRAISHGITSDQVISYLSTHAHPQLLKASAAHGGGPVLPPTVVDQIRLWQIENERMKATSGFLFKEFENQKEYDACAKYADEVGVLAWKSDTKRMFFVSRVEQLRDYIKSRKMK